MSNKDFTNLGQEIKSIVQDAINTKDFKKLNSDISETVGSAINEVKESFRHQKDHDSKPDQDDSAYRKSTYSKTGTWQSSTMGNFRTGQENRRKERQRVREARDYNGKVNYNFSPPVNRAGNPLITPKPVGRVSSVLFTVFGSIGLGITLAGFLTVGIVSLASGTLSFAILFWLAVFLVVFGGMMANGARIRRRVRRFRTYARLIKERKYCTVKELSLHTGRNESFIVSDLKKMIRLGMFPEGRLDENDRCLLLDQATHEQYLTMQKTLKEQENIRLKNEQQEAEQAQKLAQETELEREIREVVEEGTSYITQIRQMNDEIPGEDISNKLDTLEKIIARIFEHIKKHPDQIPEIRKFMEYYMPTTLKLVTAYKEFDSQPIQGKNIITAKAEIEETLVTINEAFASLLDSLFEDAAMDISTDISVLETMLAQEGLTKKDFEQ